MLGADRIRLDGVRDARRRDTDGVTEGSKGVRCGGVEVERSAERGVLRAEVCGGLGDSPFGGVSEIRLLYPLESNSNESSIKNSHDRIRLQDGRLERRHDAVRQVRDVMQDLVHRMRSS